MQKKLLLTTSLIMISAFSNQAAAADQASIEALQAQMAIMMERIEALETENQTLKQNVTEVTQTVNAAPPPPAVRNIEPASGDTKIPGTDTTVKLGGYIKADFITDIGSDYGGDFAKFSAIPLDGSAADDKSSGFHAHARQTRINLTTSTPSSMGDITTFAEIDFYGTRGSDLVTNNHAPELRQAWGKVGNVLAGQAWTNFVDLGAYPESLDFGGPAGVTIMRQTQLRYTDSINDSLSYILAIENPNSDFTNGSGDTVSSYERYPDVVAAITKKGDWGHASLRGVLRDISVENETTGQDESEFGYGVTATAKLMVHDKNNLKLRATYGDGIGRYLYDVATSGKAASYNNGKLETNEAFSGYAAYQHHWTDTVRSNFMGGYTHMDNATDLIGTGQNENIWSGHANLIWQPAKKYKVGLEYMHGERELDNGTDGSLDRVQASFIYSLN